MLPTHDTFEGMAAAIFKAAEDPNFPGIVPWDDAAHMLVGYIKAAPRRQRTYEDQWCCPMAMFKSVARNPETLERLRALVSKGTP